MSPDVLTLQNLEAWSRAGASLAVLGHPIEHSISPAMHNAALRHLAATRPELGSWQYFRFDVEPASLPEALERLHQKGFRGLNLTVPHKILALDCVASIDEAARPCGAVNTLLWQERGWRGFNTDGYGLAAGIRDTLHCELAGAKIVLLGAGGAARGAAVECVQRGCASLTIINRSRESLDALLALVRSIGGAVAIRGVVAAEMTPEITAGALVINATSAGLRSTDAMPLNLAQVNRPAAVFDMIYNPPRTALLREADRLGIPAANGLSMLVHQGAKALEIWTAAPAHVTAPLMDAAARAALR